MSCDKEIAWYDNVPLLSYLLLRGRCRHCQARIPFVYPGVELVTAVLLAGCVLEFGLTAQAAVAAFFCTVLVAVSAIDLEHRIIPNRHRPPGDRRRARCEHGTRSESGVGVVRAGRFGLPVCGGARLSGRHGHGRRKLALLMGAALGRTVSVALMAGMLARWCRASCCRAARLEGAQDGYPFRSVPRDRFVVALLGPRDPARVLLDAALVLRA